MGYSVALLNKIHGDGEREVKVMYDVACRMRVQLEASQINMDKVTLAVPVFHGYAHAAACQVCKLVKKPFPKILYIAQMWGIF